MSALNYPCCSLDPNGTRQRHLDMRSDCRFPQVSSSIKGHMQDLPDLVETVKVGEVPSGDKDGLMAAWKAWVQECGEFACCVRGTSAPTIHSCGVSFCCDRGTDC